MRISPSVRAVTSSDGGALLDLDRGKMFRINATGSTIVELLERGLSEEHVARELSARCSIDLEVASADVRDFVAVLKRHELIDMT